MVLLLCILEVLARVYVVSCIFCFFAAFDLFPCSFAMDFCSVVDMLDELREFFIYIVGGFGQMLRVVMYFCH